MGLLAALVALLCIYTPVRGAEGCSSFKHLENGRTFFRYRGLLVVFRCHPGYKLHGYKTNSCVSGHWSRDTPVCVGSGCSNPGLLIHGTSRMNEDGSWAVFSCNTGFQLHGPSMLYCKGRTWNSTKPVCKESDMMSSVSGVTVQKPNMHQHLQTLKTQQQSHYDTLANAASKEANLKFGLLSQTASQTSNDQRIKATNPKIHLQQQIQLPNFKIRDVTQNHEARETKGSHGAGRRDGSETAEKLDNVTSVFASKSHTPAAVSSTLPLVSRTERSTVAPSFPTGQTTAVKHTLPTGMFGTTSPLKLGKAVTSQNNATPTVAVTDVSQAAAQTGFQVSSSPSVQPTKTSSYFLVSGSSSPASPASSTLSLPPVIPSSSSASSSTQSNVKKQLSSSTTAESSARWVGRHDVTLHATSKPPVLPLSPARRPVCPYPPVPVHGTFYFRNVENPGPSEYRHYIQYACYPGYTLAHGDIHSYCQQGDTWSGITPVCVELTPCSVNNGGCSQLCSRSQHFSQSSNRTQTRTQCHCRPGFTLLDDGRTCRDLDECVEGQHRCQQRCINTFGSFECSCDDGYQPAHDWTSCIDVDECLLPAAVTGCVFGCVNTPGSFYCKCPAGYSLQSADSDCQDVDECSINDGLGPCMEQCHNSPGSYRCSCRHGHTLAGDGHGCVAECPPGYRKQPTTTPENSTAQALKEECVDINECDGETCEWQCVNLPGSHRCICPRGYTLHEDGRRCKDINECTRRNGGCSHLCINQKGGHKCACPPSHRLSPYSWKKCQPRTTTNATG